MTRSAAAVEHQPSLFSLAGTIDYAAARLPPALVAPVALAAVRRIATSIPASLTSWIDFECRLQRDRPQVDLSIRIDRRGRCRLADDSLGENSDFPDTLLERQASPAAAAWRRVAAFARAWADASTPTYRDVAAAWLEFDLEADHDAAACPPRLFIDFARTASPADRRAAMMTALAPVVGNPIPAWLCEGVGRCLRALPPGAELLYVGLPADERITTVRLCALGMDEQHAAGYLEAVGWPGDVAALRWRLGSWRRPGRDTAARAAILQFDLCDRDDRGRIGSRLGLEYPLRRRSQVKGAIADVEWLDDLVACGACAADKREALLAWPGCEVAVLPHELWPSLVMRRVSHVKIVCDRDEPLEAKAYLCFAHERRPLLRFR